jgi:hypothetical protein
MTAEPQPLTTLTFEEYLKFEELSEERHEFVAGTVGRHGTPRPA